VVTTILAIFVHYALEFGKNMGDYKCPLYCEIKHEHKISEEKLNGRYNDNKYVKREEGKHLHGIKRDDKHTSSEREEGTGLH